MHTKYHTDAFVVRSDERRESDKIFVLLTRELGMVSAYAQGVRKLNSKHRFGLNDLFEAEVSLVRGRAGMRLVHVTPKKNIYKALAPYPKNLEVCVNILRLAERLMPRAESAEEIYSSIKSATEALVREIDPQRVAAIEAATILKILYDLGYVQHDEPFKGFVRSEPQMDALYLDQITAHKREIVREINRALAASQL